MLFLIFNEIEKPKKDLIYFLFFSFWVQYLTVLLALDLKTACEDGGVLNCLCGFDEGGFGDSSTPSVVTAETASERNSLNDRHHTTVFTELHRGVKTLQKKTARESKL